MINPEKLHDALTLLPEELLIPVDVLRRKKRAVWKPVAALAACLALVVGLWFLFPGGAVSADNAGAAPEAGSSDGSFGALTDHFTGNSASGTGYLSATVLDVAQDYITVRLDGNTADIAVAEITVSLKDLQDIPVLEKGQSVKIYCKDLSDPTVSLIPYKIEVTEKEDEQ